jgi:hypothetical protein
MLKKINRRNLLKNFLGTSSTIFGLQQGLLKPNDGYAQTIYNPNLTQLTQFYKGDLPILIIAPHGGTELVYGIPPRRNINRPVANFSYYGAVWTREICTQISRTIENLSGGRKPYMVLNLAHRRYVDVNREESDAYEVILNAPRIYWEYHDLINEYINRMNVLYENPILIEISGQQELPDVIIRRTLNGESIERLITSYGEKKYNKELRNYLESYKRVKGTDKESDMKTKIQEYKNKKQEKIKEYGDIVYIGEDSLISEIKKRGYKINPDLFEKNTEQALSIAGDYTLQRYGSRDINKINAIQLVIGSDYRRTTNFKQTGYDIGNALWAFAEKFIITTS